MRDSKHVQTTLLGDLETGGGKPMSRDEAPLLPPGDWRVPSGWRQVEREQLGRSYRMPKHSILLRWHDGWRLVTWCTQPCRRGEDHIVTLDTGSKVPVVELAALRIGSFATASGAQDLARQRRAS